MNQVQQEMDRYVADFRDLESRLNGQRNSALHGLRKTAMERFADIGFPTTRHEEWKYTNAATLARIPFRPGAPVRITPGELASLRNRFYGDEAGCFLVLINGHFQPDLSVIPALPAGVIVSSLADAIASRPELVERNLGELANFTDSSFNALNTAFFTDGIFIHIGRGISYEEPIRILNISTAPDGPAISHPRALIVLEESSQATVSEAFVGLGEGVCFTNAISEIALAANATLDHYKLHQERPQSYHIATISTNQEQNTNLSTHSFMVGAALVRNDLKMRLAGSGCETTLNGLYLANGQQHVDNHTAIDHAMPHCNSREIYHGVLAGRARGVFNGKIFVRQDAQKTDARQTNRNLLLSNEAEMDTKPQLEIFADDVKCTHGATIGQLDEDSIFYLRARGIPKDEATSLLTLAFAREIVDGVKIESVRERLEHQVLSWFTQGITQEVEAGS